jgi:hypothetical protein
VVRLKMDSVPMERKRLILDSVPVTIYRFIL